jgi:hypothetical protein
MQLVPLVQDTENIQSFANISFVKFCTTSLTPAFNFFFARRHRYGGRSVGIVRLQNKGHGGNIAIQLQITNCCLFYDT